MFGNHKAVMSRKVPEWSTNVCSNEEMQKKCESCSVTRDGAEAEALCFHDSTRG